MDGEDNRGLLNYMWLVTVAASPVIAVTGWQAVRGGWPLLPGRLGLVIVVFSLVLVAGEMWPIPVARGEESGDEITVSSTFGLALLLIAPVFFSVLAQTIALVIDWKLRRRRWHRLPFNVAQYALAFISARAVYAMLAGLPFGAPMTSRPPHLLAAVAAGAAFLLMNNTLVGLAVALRLRVRLRWVLSQDARWQLMTSAPLLGLGPLAAQAALWTPLSIVLLLIPIVALHRSGHTAMKREQEALRDPLTGLANRTMLSTATDRALRTCTAATAMLLIDLDHFKDVNDTLGHAVGDELLRAIAGRLVEQAAPTDLVARLGGDEFVVLARGSAGRDSAVELAQRLGNAINHPYRVQGVVLTIGCSVGIGLAPDHANTVEGLLRCADVALYAAKAVRGTYAVYDRHSDQHSAALLGLQSDLRSALEDEFDEQVYVLFQPQLDLRTGKINSVECLVRWQHPELGLLMPDNFIPMAESTSLIDLLMRRVLELTLAQLAAWDRGGVVLSAAVNLSARQLSDLTLPETVGAALARHGIPAGRLVLEVTESRLMSDPERSIDILRRLQAMGVELSIDDFGTGYSSLAYLQRLAVDELKIDKSFTLGLHEPGNATIIRSTIELGHNLGLRVIAEGVENPAAAQQLAEMGCDMLQGYLIGRPGRADDLQKILLGARQTPFSWLPAGRHERSRAALALVPPQPSPVPPLMRPAAPAAATSVPAVSDGQVIG